MCLEVHEHNDVVVINTDALLTLQIGGRIEKIYMERAKEVGVEQTALKNHIINQMAAALLRSGMVKFTKEELTDVVEYKARVLVVRDVS